VSSEEQRQVILASIDVWCCACGHSFPGTTQLHSGLCANCVREARKRPWQVMAENERLREALDAIVTYSELPHDRMGAECGEGPCISCLIHGTAAEALDAR
jgi:hypothetical protein